MKPVASRGPAPPDAAFRVARRLHEIVRQLERYVDHQVQASGELDRKNEVLLSVVLALTGGGIALLGTIRPLNATGIDPTAVLLLLGSTSLAGAAVVLTDAYLGLTQARAPKMYPGIDPIWLAEVAADESFTAEHVAYATTGTLRLGVEKNERELTRRGRLRRAAFYLGLAGLALYAIGTFFIRYGK